MTIPASTIVTVNPSVLSAGGGALDLIGMFLTSNIRVPMGTVSNFLSAAAVATFFGASSPEAAAATVYFSGFDTSVKKPASLNFAQYPVADVAAYLRGGNASGLTLAQLQAINAALTVTINGSILSATVNLAGATSFSSAASLIATALNAAAAAISLAAFNGSIATGSASVTGYIAGNVLYVTGGVTGFVPPGAALSGTGILANTVITSQLTGTPGGVGTYAINNYHAGVASETMTASYGVLTAGAPSSGTLSVGQAIAGAGVNAGTILTALGTGTGGAGTYYLNLSQTVASIAMNARPAGCAVTYDSVSGAFLVQSATTGPSSTIGFASGAAAVSLLLTQATSAVLSQGAAAAQPAGFMPGIINVTQNWANLALPTLDVDGSLGLSTAQRQLFAAWANTTNNRYAYVAHDYDPNAKALNPAPASLGYLLAQLNQNGTIVNWEAAQTSYLDAFVCGVAASINFNVTNGRVDPTFRTQAGLATDVTDPVSTANLQANGYNYYGAYATASNNWNFYYPGKITGAYLWADTYWNQIWLNNGLLIALMNLLIALNSIPYNQAGYTLVREACGGPIRAAVNAGVIRKGVTLSATQILAISTAAGPNAVAAVQSRGWYLQIQDAPPSVRQARQSPVINLWYTDGESIQQITLGSIVVQ